MKSDRNLIQVSTESTISKRLLEVEQPGGSSSLAVVTKDKAIECTWIRIEVDSVAELASWSFSSH